MASARIVHYWPDDDGSTWFEIEVPESYPDALDEARCQVTRMFRECVDTNADEAGE